MDNQDYAAGYAAGLKSVGGVYVSGPQSYVAGFLAGSAARRAMGAREYGVWQHPLSGDRYAVRYNSLGYIVEAAGPLHHSEGLDAEDVRDYLSNQGMADLEDDAAWVRDEIVEHGEGRRVAYWPAVVA